jgi:epoxide hydrolase-like predicted phosphatase
MISTEIEAIIFDYGGVLINIDYQATVDEFKKIGIYDFDAMYSQAEQSDLFNQIETGQITPDEFVQQLLRLLPKGTEPEQVVNAWNAIIKDVPKKSIKLLKALKQKGYKIYLLSNTNALHIEVANIEWDKVSVLKIEEIMDAVYYSHIVGLRKPDESIFEFVCTKHKLDVSKTLFIDDSIQHIEGAKKIGLQTYHLKNKEDIQDLFS